MTPRREMLGAFLFVAVPLVSCRGGEPPHEDRIETRPRRQSESPLENPLVGVWSITETSIAGPADTSVNESPQPGLYIFTDRHFSIVLIPGAERPPFSSSTTDAQRLAAYDNLIVDAGRYRRTDSTFAIENIIAKIPNVMPPHSTGDLTFRYRLGEDADSLILTLQGGWAPPDAQITYRLRRLE